MHQRFEFTTEFLALCRQLRFGTTWRRKHIGSVSMPQFNYTISRESFINPEDRVDIHSQLLCQFTYRRQFVACFQRTRQTLRPQLLRDLSRNRYRRASLDMHKHESPSKVYTELQQCFCRESRRGNSLLPGGRFHRVCEVRVKKQMEFGSGGIRDRCVALFGRRESSTF